MVSEKGEHQEKDISNRISNGFLQQFTADTFQLALEPVVWKTQSGERGNPFNFLTQFFHSKSKENIYNSSI